MKEFMITTFDNPFNPFEEFVAWFLYDVEKGYNTCSLLARIVQTTDDMTEKEMIEANNKAIDLIITNDELAMYKRVTQDSIVA